MRPTQKPSQVPRVLYVENGIGYGGAVICLRHLIQNLDPARYRPLLVTGRTGPEYAPLADDAPWWVLPDRRLDTRAWKQAIDHNSQRLPLPLSWLLRQAVARSDDVVNFLPHLLALFRLALRERPALIHANNEPLNNRAALLVARALNIPSVCHVRGVLPDNALTHRCYRLPSRIISVSHWIDAGLSGLKLPASRRTVIYDGIALERMQPDGPREPFRSALGASTDDFLVGLVGLLIPWKGQRLLLDAAPRLFAALPRLRLAFLGTTPEDCQAYEAELRARVATAPWRDRIHFVGHVTDMPAAYRGLDVVLSASVEPEPLGTVVIEAMAMARPLVAPAFGGAAEMAEHEATALLFEPGNSDALTAAILRLAEEPDLGPRLGQAARQHALATFAVATHAERVQAVYDQVLAQPAD